MAPDERARYPQWKLEVIAFSNGQVVVMDASGEQVPQLQGPRKEALRKIAQWLLVEAECKCTYAAAMRPADEAYAAALRTAREAYLAALRTARLACGCDECREVA